MDESVIRKTPLPWWAAGLLLAAVMLVAVAVKKPLGVSTQFVVADTQVLEVAAPGYTASHPVISSDKYRKLGYGWWLDVGLVVGAAAAAVAAGRWSFRKSTAWWTANHGPSAAKRFVAAFLGGFFILLGARIAHGCTSGQMASGLAQLSLSAIPFTVGLFGVGMIVARIVYPKAPETEE